MDKKKIIIFAAVALTVIIGALLLISLLGGDDEEPAPNNNNSNNEIPKTENVTLEYWGLWEPSEVMNPLIQEYEDQNPGVTIQYSQESFTQYEENAFTRIKQGSIQGSPAPDIFRINNSWLPKFQPYLAPLPQNVMSSQEYAANFYPTAVNDFTGSDNNIFAIPLEIDGLALFYNKQLLTEAGVQEPPSDWDSIISTAKQLTKKDSAGNIEQAGIALGTSNNIMHSSDIIALLLLQNGIDVYQPATGEISISSTRGVAALEFYTEFVTKHETWSPDLPTDLEMFFSGKLAMMVAPSWRSFDILNANTQLEFGLAPTPTIQSPPVYYSMYWGEAVSAKSSNPAEAWKFVKWLSEEPQLKKLYSNSSNVRAFGEPYSRQDMNSLMEGQPYVSAIATMAPNMQSWQLSETSFVKQTFEDMITDVVDNDVQSETALTNAEEEINTELATFSTTE
jgi:multiple sugar transport system substrate-binding protein